MPEQSSTSEEQPQSLFERWQKEQQNWQRLITDYVDKASTDESFLINLGNAMRGSLLANKPYPGTAPTGVAGDTAGQQSEIDEVVFAVRRLEGQISELTMAIDRLGTHELTAPKKKSSTPKQGK